MLVAQSMLGLDQRVLNTILVELWRTKVLTTLKEKHPGIILLFIAFPWEQSDRLSSTQNLRR